MIVKKKKKKRRAKKEPKISQDEDYDIEDDQPEDDN